MKHFQIISDEQLLQESSSNSINKLDFISQLNARSNEILIDGSHIISEKSLLPRTITKKQKENLNLFLYKLNINNQADQKVVKMIKDAEKLILNSQLDNARLRPLDSSTESSIKFQQDFESMRNSQAENHNFLNQNYQDLEFQLKQLTQWISRVQDNTTDSAISLAQNSAVPSNLLQGTILCSLYQKLIEIKKENTMKVMVFNLTGVDYTENIEYLINTCFKNQNSHYGSRLRYVSFMPFDDCSIDNYENIAISPQVTVIPYQRSDLDQFQLNFFYENFLKQELMYIPRQSVIVILLSSTQNYCLAALQTIIRKCITRKQKVFVHIDALIKKENNYMDIEEDNNLTNNVFNLINVSFSAFANQKIHKSPTKTMFNYERDWIDSTLSYIFDKMSLTISQRELLEGQQYYALDKSQSIEPIKKELRMPILQDDDEIMTFSIDTEQSEISQTFVDHETSLIVGYSENQVFYSSFSDTQKINQILKINEEDGIIINPTIFTIKQYIIVAFGVNCDTKQLIPYIYIIDTATNNYMKCSYQQVLSGILVQATDEKKNKDKQKIMQRYGSDLNSSIVGQNYVNEEHWIEKIKYRRNPGVSKVSVFQKKQTCCDEQNTLCFMLIGGESEKNEIMNIVECIYVDLNTQTFESYIIEKSSILLYKNVLYPIHPESSQKILLEQISPQQEAIIILPGTQTLDYKFNSPLNNRQENTALVYIINDEGGVSILRYQLNQNNTTGRQELTKLYATSKEVNCQIKWNSNKDSNNIKKVIKNGKTFWVMLNNFFIYNQNLMKEEILSGIDSQETEQNKLISIAELFDRLFITILHVDHEKQQIDIAFRVKEKYQQFSFQPSVVDPKALEKLHTPYIEESTQDISVQSSILRSQIIQQEQSKVIRSIKQVDLYQIFCQQNL